MQEMRTFRIRSAWLGICAAAWLAPISPAVAVDEPGSSDHPLIGRYDGSSIAYYRQSSFDEAALLRAPHDYSALLEGNRLDDRSGNEWLKAEGAVAEIRYDIPAGRSSLEVMRNHRQALEANGFAPVFSCADKECFTGGLRDSYLLGQQLDPSNGVSTAYFDCVRYLLVSRNGAEGGAAYAAILTGKDKGQVTAFLRVVETKVMEADKIAFTDASAMRTALDETRLVDVYGILFDTDRDSLKPESKPTLDEIASLLTSNPGLNLKIVGHTDNVGAPDYNLDLSNRRAASVVAALTRDYGIAAERLQSSGAGLTAPIAYNDTPEGQAQNRRVELVAK
jgi:OmpA-OmpF porin, OOP family